MNPWLVQLIVVRGGSYTASERRSISRDRERGLFHRIRQGVYVATVDWNDGEGPVRELARHVLRARAFDAVAPERPRFSHWTSAVIQSQPVIDVSLDCVHVTTLDDRLRGRDGVLTHALALSSSEVVEVNGLLMTDLPRTVIDIAGQSSLLGGLVTANGALFSGVERDALQQAIELAGPRRASARIADVAAMAHPGAETAAESASYASMFRLGLEPPELQHEVWDDRGLAGVLDSYHRRFRVGTEVDGFQKYLDPTMAPGGPGKAVIAEKRREDRVRAGLEGFARYGYWEAKDPMRLRPILAKAGIRPPEHRPTVADWATAARYARPRLIIPRR